MLVPFPVEPVRKKRFRVKLLLRQLSIEARWLVAADDSAVDGVSEYKKSLKPSATVQGIRTLQGVPGCRIRPLSIFGSTLSYLEGYSAAKWRRRHAGLAFQRWIAATLLLNQGRRSVPSGVSKFGLATSATCCSFLSRSSDAFGAFCFVTSSLSLPSCSNGLSACSW